MERVGRTISSYQISYILLQNTECLLKTQEQGDLLFMSGGSFQGEIKTRKHLKIQLKVEYML